MAIKIVGKRDNPVVEVQGDSGKIYRVDVVNGRCSCPAWKFSRNGSRDCKHLRALKIESYQGGRGTMITLPDWSRK